jgi:uncharacterized protein (DUF58 family)
MSTPVSTSSDAAPLLSPEMLAKLETLDLLSRKVFQGRMKGERKSTRKGRSVEFADFRNYAQGDDLRFVDWNIFARLEKLFVKLFLEEEDLHFYVLVDNSPSMEFGDPTKLRVAKQLTAALSFIGLIRQHRVRIETLGQSLRRPGPIWRGRQNTWRMLEYVEGLAGDEKGSLWEGVKNFGLRNTGRGIVVLISDLMDKQGYEAAFRFLAARRMDTYVVHLLSSEELKPEVLGDLKLIDCEDEEATEISVGASLLKAYDRTLQTYLAEVRDFCARRALGYLFVDNQMPVEKIVAETLHRQGLVG